MLYNSSELKILNAGTLQKSIKRSEAKAVHKELPPGGQWKTMNGHHIYILNGKVLAGAVPGVGKPKKATKAQLQEHQKNEDSKGAKASAKANAKDGKKKPAAPPAKQTGKANPPAKPATAKPSGKKTSPAAKEVGKPDAKGKNGSSGQKASAKGAEAPKGRKPPVKRDDAGPALVVSPGKGKPKGKEEAAPAKAKGEKVDGKITKPTAAAGGKGGSTTVAGKTDGGSAGSSKPRIPRKPRGAATPKDAPSVSKPANESDAKGAPKSAGQPVSGPGPASGRAAEKSGVGSASKGSGRAVPGKNEGTSAKPVGRSRKAASGAADKSGEVSAKGPAKRAPKLVIADVRSDAQKNRELAYDVGDKIGGARKDMLRMDFYDNPTPQALASLEKDAPELASTSCTKKNILKPIDYEAEYKNGTDINAAFLKSMIYDRITPKPKEDTPEARMKYLSGIRELHRIIHPIKDYKELKSALSDLGTLARMGAELSDAEHKLSGKSGHSFVNEEYYTEKVIKGRAAKALMDFSALGDKLENFFVDTNARLRSYSTVQGKKLDWEVFFKPAEEQEKDANEAEAQRGALRGATKKRWERMAVSEHQRTGGKETPIKKPEDMVKHFGMKGVEFGNWVDDSAGLYHLKRSAEAFHDLADIMGIDDKDISLNGRLSMAFGARGKGGALAHYEPERKVINMTKHGGAGSLAHEWGHALDNILHAYSKGLAGSVSMASEGVGDSDPELATLYNNLMEAITKPAPGGKGGTKKITIDSSLKSLGYHKPGITNQIANGMTPEEVYNSWAKKINAEADGGIQRAKNNPMRSPADLAKRIKKLERERTTELNALPHLIAGAMRQQLPGNGYKTGEHVKTEIHIPTGDSEYLSRMQAMDGGGKSYYTQKCEMFARVFESMIEDKMSASKRKNNYLVWGTKTTRGTDAPFPVDEERKHMHAAMDALVQYIGKGKTLKKALAMELQKALFNYQDLYARGAAVWKRAVEIAMQSGDNKAISDALHGKYTQRLDQLMKQHDPEGLLKSFVEADHPRAEDGRFTDGTEEHHAALEAQVEHHNGLLMRLASRFGSAEEFAAHVDRPGFGGVSVTELYGMIDNNSHNHLDADAIKTTLNNGGKQYYLTHVDPKSLYIQDEQHLAGVHETAFNQAKAKPIVVGKSNFIVDGRHRTVNAKESGSSRILAYVPAEHFYNQHIQGDTGLKKTIVIDPAGNSPYPEDNTIMFRGIGEREHAAILATGYIQSKGKGNDDDKGIDTCFTNRFQQAEGYARSQYQLYDEKQAYVVALPRPDWVVEDEHGELIADRPVPASFSTFIPIGPELQKSVTWNEAEHPRRPNGEFGSGGDTVQLFHGTALVHAETILAKGFKAKRSGNGDMGKCAYFKSPDWDHKEALAWAHTARIVNNFAEDTTDKTNSAPRVIQASIAKEHLLDCSKGRPQELQDMIDATRYKGLKDGEPRWDKAHSPYEAYAKKHGIKAIVDKLDTVWEDEGWQIGVYDPKIIQIIDSGKSATVSGGAVALQKALASEAAYCLLHHEFSANGNLVLHIGAH